VPHSGCGFGPAGIATAERRAAAPFASAPPASPPPAGPRLAERFDGAALVRFTDGSRFVTPAASNDLTGLHSTVRRAVTFLAAMAVLVALYFGRGVLVPVSLALLLTFALGGPVSRLEKLGLGRGLSVALVMGALMVVLSCLAWVVFTQLEGVLEELPAHRVAIRHKVSALASHFSALKELSNYLGPDTPSTPTATVGTSPDQPLYVSPAQTGSGVLQGLASVLASLLNPIGTAGMVMLFALFMLLHREDLRNRCIRLMSHGDLTVTTQALTESGDRVGRYLATQATINTTFGAVMAVGLLLLGVPGWALWGFLCGLLRFVPYIGGFLGIALPAAMALATTPGWGLFFATIGVWAAVEVTINVALEPRFYGASAGISPFAVLVGAAVWTWLWGPVGLVLAMPMTVVVVVLGKNVPQLAFLHVLLGNEEVLSPGDRYYQRMIARDPFEGVKILEEVAETQTLAEIYETILIPALAAAERDRAAGKLGEDDYTAACDDIRESLEEMESRHAEETGASGNAAAAEPLADELVVLPAPGSANEVAAAVLCRLLQHGGHGCRTASSDLTTSEQVDQLAPSQTLCVLSLSDPTLRHLRAMCQRARSRRSDLCIIAMAWGATIDPKRWRSRALTGCSDAAATDAACLTLTLADIRQRQLAPEPEPAAGPGARAAAPARLPG
jgi:predicted PurR-regulated permease PerM